MLGRVSFRRLAARMYDQVSAEILPSAQVTELDLNKDRYVLKT